MANTNLSQTNRAPLTLKIKFKSATVDEFINRYAVDISNGGIFIRTKQPLDVGTPLRFEFQLRDASPLLSGDGTVVWTREHDPSRAGVAPGMGVRFDRLPPESQDVLDRILATKEKNSAMAQTAQAPEPEPAEHPTRVAPMPLVDELARGGVSRPLTTPFQSDVDDFDPDAFEEATKVASLDELVAKTAEQERGDTLDDPEAARADFSDNAPTPIANVEIPPQARLSRPIPALTPDGEQAAPPMAAAAPQEQFSAEPLTAPPGERAETENDALPPLNMPAAEAPVAPPAAPAPSMLGGPIAAATDGARPGTLPPPTAEPGSLADALEPSDDALGPASMAEGTLPQAEMPVPRAVTRASDLATDESSGLMWIAAALAVALVVGGGFYAVVQFGGIEIAGFGADDSGGEPADTENAAAPGATDDSATDEPAEEQAEGSAEDAEGAEGAVGAVGAEGTATAEAGDDDTTNADDDTAETPVEFFETTVESTPAGATVELVGDDQSGTAPFTLTIDPTVEQQVKLSLDGYRPLVVTLAPDQEKQSFTLEKWTRRLKVTSTPAGAQVFINDRRKGLTPATIELTGPLATAKAWRVSVRKAGFVFSNRVLSPKDFTEAEDALVSTVNASLTRRQTAPKPTPKPTPAPAPDSGDSGDNGAAGSGGAADDGDNGAGDTTESAPTPAPEPEPEPAEAPKPKPAPPTDTSTL